MHFGHRCVLLPICLVVPTALLVYDRMLHAKFDLSPRAWDQWNVVCMALVMYCWGMAVIALGSIGREYLDCRGYVWRYSAGLVVFAFGLPKFFNPNPMFPYWCSMLVGCMAISYFILSPLMKMSDEEEAMEKAAEAVLRG